MGVLILTHRRLLVDQFTRDLTTEGYGGRLRPAVLQGQEPLQANPLTIQTYAWFARHVGSVSRSAYQLVICDEAHTALGEKTSAAIRGLTEPIYIGMTATEQLIAKQVSDVFPASVDDLPLGDAARRGLIAPCAPCACGLRRPSPPFPSSAGTTTRRSSPRSSTRTSSARRPRACTATASTPRRASSTRPGSTTPTTWRGSSEAAGSRPSAAAPAGRLAETLAAYERGDINVLVNAQLLAEGWNSPRATICMHLAPTASRRVYQQRIGRIMRLAPRKEAGIVVDFVDDAATHTTTAPSPSTACSTPTSTARRA